VALSKRHSRRAMPALRKCLESRGHELHRGQKRVLIVALGGVPHVSTVPVLAKALSDRSYRMRSAAAWALAQIRAPESSAALEAAADELSWLHAFPARRGLRVRTRRDDDG
jgi:HEAT repeat protein